MISYAKSIVDSISELQSRSVISEMYYWIEGMNGSEDAIFSNHEESNHQLESAYLVPFCCRIDCRHIFITIQRSLPIRQIFLPTIK